MQPIDTSSIVEPLRVYVVGGGIEYIRMFFGHGFRGARGVDDADVVCFTGGADVNPALYDEKALSCTHFSIERDKVETEIFDKALRKGTPMVGICRGAQFLNVMSGGKLWQDVDKHGIGGTHEVVDFATGQIRNVTSTHHQQMIPAEGEAKVLAAAGRSTYKAGYGRDIEKLNPARAEMDDIEAVWYEDTQCLCFQPHPEIYSGEGDCRKYFFELFDTYIYGPLNTRT